MSLPKKKKQRKPSLCSFRLETQVRSDQVIGLDEAGRGPLAGPLVAAAVSFDSKFWSASDPIIDEVGDSKSLSEKKRRWLFEGIKERAAFFKIVEVEAAVIDQLNILQACFQAFRQTLSSKEVHPAAYVLIDGHLKVPRLPQPQHAVVGGDSVSKSIAAASILAKVHRDNLMRKYDIEYPQYGFAKHKGYGTKAHWKAIEEYGPCPIHRMSFLSRILKKEEGDRSEKLVAERLLSQGYRLVEKNWRSRTAEIDLVVEKAGELRFIEVRKRKWKDIEMAFPKTKQDQLRKAVKSFLNDRAQLRSKRLHIDFYLVGEDSISAFRDVFNF